MATSSKRSDRRRRRQALAWKGIFTGIRARVAAFVFITASLSLVLTSGLISQQVLNFQQREFDSELYNLVLDESQQVRITPFGMPLAPAGGFSFGRRSLFFPEALAFFQILSPDGHITYKSAGLGDHILPWEPSDWTALLDEDVVFRTLSPEVLGVKEKAPFRVISVPVIEGHFLRGVLQLAVPIDVIEREKEELNSLFGFLIPILVGVLALGSYWIAGRALVPLRELISRTRGIAPEDLSVRLPIPSTGDEIAELTWTLNRLLARLQSAFDSQERFIADASHQLKTPLAILRGEIELLQQRNPSPEEVREFLKSAHEEVRHLTKLVEGLLILARVSALPETALVKTTVRLDEILIGLLERHQPALERRGIKCRFQAAEDVDFEVRGDEDLLRSLFETLIDNAVKYSPDQGLIEVSLFETAFGEDRENQLSKGIEVLICDEGRGIPQDLQERVFDRFYRADTGSHGFGLGLTIARQIVRAHGGEIGLEPREGRGTCVRVKMKKISSNIHR